MRIWIVALILLLVFVPFITASETPAAEGAHGEKAAGASHEKTYFGIPGWILKLVNMILFIAFLMFILRGPVKNAFAARGEAIRKAREEATERRARADTMAAEIQARLGRIEQEVQTIRDKAVAEGERQKKELLAAAEAEAARILTAARNEVDNRVKRARQELTEYAGELASERAEALLREKITDTDKAKLFRDGLAQIGETR